MKALAFKVPKTEKESFKVQYDDLPYFYNRMHHHPELQITLIDSGAGTRFVGDSIGVFQPGDLLFIGAHIPHWFRNEPQYFEAGSKLRARSISVFFREDSFGANFFELPEMSAIREMLYKARRGISIKGTAKAQITKKLRSIRTQAPATRILFLLEILDTIARSDQWEYLSGMAFHPGQDQRQSQRLNQIFQWAMDHYDQPVELAAVARATNMSVSTFCRFFKLRTRKTFIQFVNEIRISAACSLLREGDWSISEIAYRVGFYNQSNFNRQFKKITGYTPSDYISTFDRISK